jgi:hypothetical protein
LLRYIFEYQYLRFSAVADPRTFFLQSTWCAADFIASGVLGGEQFDQLTAAVAQVCDAFAVDESRFRTFAAPLLGTRTVGTSELYRGFVVGPRPG